MTEPTDIHEEVREGLRQRAICVVVPTYNNAGTLSDVLNDIRRYCADIIVVNDGSTDGTAGILAQAGDVTVVAYARNRGKGYALKQGLLKARDMGFAYAVTMDADGQHYAADIAQMLEANRAHPGCLIVGARRMEGAAQDAGSSFANRFANFWLAVQTGRRLPDTQSGFRLYPVKKMGSMWYLTSRYEAELELLVWADWHGIGIHSVPVGVYYPPAEERVSHFRPAADFARISVLNTVLCVLAVVYGYPRKLLRLLGRVCRTVYSFLFFAIFVLCIATPAVWLYLKIGPVTEAKRRKLHVLIQRCARFVMFGHGIPGVKTKYAVADPKVFDKPAIVICNHQSHLDLLCQLVFTPRMVFLTKEWVWNNPFYGFIIRHAEFYPVTEGVEQMAPKLESLIGRGYQIAVYPEGTRSRDCRIGRFHKGAFYLAERFGLDIVPMYLYGPGKVLPRGKALFRKGTIYVEVGPAVTRAELEAMGDTRQQASCMRRRYQAKYEQLCNKIEQDV